MSDGGVRVSNREIYDSVQELKAMVYAINVEIAYLKEERSHRRKAQLSSWLVVASWALGVPVSVLGMVF